MPYSSAFSSKKDTPSKSIKSTYYVIFSHDVYEICFVKREQWISHWVQVIDIWILQDVN